MSAGLMAAARVAGLGGAGGRRGRTSMAGGEEGRRCWSLVTRAFQENKEAVKKQKVEVEGGVVRRRRRNGRRAGPKLEEGGEDGEVDSHVALVSSVASRTEGVWGLERGRRRLRDFRRAEEGRNGLGPCWRDGHAEETFEGEREESDQHGGRLRRLSCKEGGGGGEGKRGAMFVVMTQKKSKKEGTQGGPGQREISEVFLSKYRPFSPLRVFFCSSFSFSSLSSSPQSFQQSPTPSPSSSACFPSSSFISRPPSSVIGSSAGFSFTFPLPVFSWLSSPRRALSFSSSDRSKPALFSSSSPPSKFSYRSSSPSPSSSSSPQLSQYPFSPSLSSPCSPSFTRNRLSNSSPSTQLRRFCSCSSSPSLSGFPLSSSPSSSLLSPSPPLSLPSSASPPPSLPSSPSASVPHLSEVDGAGTCGREETLFRQTDTSQLKGEHGRRHAENEIEISSSSKGVGTATSFHSPSVGLQSSPSFRLPSLEHKDGATVDHGRERECQEKRRFASPPHQSPEGFQTRTQDGRSRPGEQKATASAYLKEKKKKREKKESREKESSSSSSSKSGTSSLLKSPFPSIIVSHTPESSHLNLASSSSSRRDLGPTTCASDSILSSVVGSREGGKEEEEEQRGEEVNLELHQGDLSCDGTALSPASSCRVSDTAGQSSHPHAAPCSAEERQMRNSPEDDRERARATDTLNATTSSTDRDCPDASPGKEIQEENKKKKKRKRKKKQGPATSGLEEGQEGAEGGGRREAERRGRESQAGAKSSGKTHGEPSPPDSRGEEDEAERERGRAGEAAESNHRPSVLKRLAKAPWAARLLRELSEVEKEGMRKRRRKSEGREEERGSDESSRGEQDGETGKRREKIGEGVLYDEGHNGRRKRGGDDWQMRCWWYQNAPRLFISAVRQSATYEPNVQLRMFELLLAHTPLFSAVRHEKRQGEGPGREGKGQTLVPCEKKREEGPISKAHPALPSVREGVTESVLSNKGDDTQPAPLVDFPSSCDVTPDSRTGLQGCHSRTVEAESSRGEESVREDGPEVPGKSPVQGPCLKSKTETVQGGHTEQQSGGFQCRKRREQSASGSGDSAPPPPSLLHRFSSSVAVSASSCYSPLSQTGSTERENEGCTEHLTVTEEDVRSFGPGFVLFSQDPRLPVEHRLWCIDQFAYFLGLSCRSASLQQVEDKRLRRGEENEGREGGGGSSVETEELHNKMERQHRHPSSSSSASPRSLRTEQPQQRRGDGGDEVRAGHRISPSGFLVVSDLRVWRVLAACVRWLASHGYFEFAARITYTLLTFIYDIRAFPAAPYQPPSAPSLYPPPLSSSLALSSPAVHSGSSSELEETTGEDCEHGGGEPGTRRASSLGYRDRENRQDQEESSSEERRTSARKKTRGSSPGDGETLLPQSRLKVKGGGQHGNRRKEEEELIRKRNDRWKIPKHLWLHTLAMRHHHQYPVSSASRSSSPSTLGLSSSCSSVTASTDSALSVSPCKTPGALVQSDPPDSSHPHPPYSPHALVPSLEPHEVDAVDLVDDLFLTLKNEAADATALLAHTLLLSPSSPARKTSSLSSSSPTASCRADKERGLGDLDPLEASVARGGRGKEGQEDASRKEGEEEETETAERSIRLASKFAASDERRREKGGRDSIHWREDDQDRVRREMMKRFVVVKKIGFVSSMASRSPSHPETILPREALGVQTEWLIGSSNKTHTRECREFDSAEMPSKEWEVLELFEEERTEESGEFSDAVPSISTHHHDQLRCQLGESPQQTTGRGNLIRRAGHFSPAFGFTCLAWYLRLESIFYRVQDVSLTSLACRLLAHFIKHDEPQRLFPYSPPCPPLTRLSARPPSTSPASPPTQLPRPPPSISELSSSPSSPSSPPSCTLSSTSSSSSAASSSPQSAGGEFASVLSPRSPLLALHSPLSALPSPPGALSTSTASPSSYSSPSAASSSLPSAALLMSPVGATALANIVGSLKAVRLYDHELLSRICTLLKPHLSLLPAHVICELTYNVGCLGFTDPSFADAVSSYLVHSNVLKDVKTDWIMQVLIGFTRLDLRDENLIAACIEGLLSTPSTSTTHSEEKSLSSSSLKRPSRLRSASFSSSASTAAPSSSTQSGEMTPGTTSTSPLPPARDVGDFSAADGVLLEQRPGDNKTSIDSTVSRPLHSRHKDAESGKQTLEGNAEEEEEAKRKEEREASGSRSGRGVSFSPVASSLQGAANILARTQRPASLFYLLHGISFNNVRSLRLLSALLPALHRYASVVPVNVVVLGFHDIIRMSIWPGPLRGAIVPNLKRNLHRLSLATLASSSMLCWSFWGHYDVPLLLCLASQFRLKLLEEESSPSPFHLHGGKEPASSSGDDYEESTPSYVVQHPSKKASREHATEGKKTHRSPPGSGHAWWLHSGGTNPEVSDVAQQKKKTDKRSSSLEKGRNSGTAKTITLIKASTQLWSSLYGIEVLSLTPRDFVSRVKANSIAKNSGRPAVQRGEGVGGSVEDFAHDVPRPKDTKSGVNWVDTRGTGQHRRTSHSSFSLSDGCSVPASPSPLGESFSSSGERKRGSSLLPLPPHPVSSSIPASSARHDTASYSQPSIDPPLSSDTTSSTATSSSTSSGETRKTDTGSSMSSSHPTTKLYVSALLSSSERSGKSPLLSSAPLGLVFSPWRTGSLQGLKLAKLLEIPETQWTPKSSSFHEEVLAALSTCVRGKLINEQAVGPYGIDIVIPPEALASRRGRRRAGEQEKGDDGEEEEEEEKTKKKKGQQKKKKIREESEREKKTRPRKKKLKAVNA